MKKNFAIIIIILVLIVASFLMLGQVSNSTTNSLNVFLYSLFPFLFPLLLLTSLFIALNGAQLLAFPLQFLSIPLLKISGNGCVALICCLLCGYPSSIITTNRLVSNNQICISEQQRIVNYASFVSPSFLFGSISAILLNDSLILNIYLSMLLSGLILLRLSYKKEVLNFLSIADIKLDYYHYCHNSFFSESLKDVIIQCLKTMGVILGTILFFNIIITVFDYLLPENLNLYLSGILEFSIASIKLAKQPLTLTNLAFLTFFLTWSGLAVILQTISLTKKDFSIKSFLIAKLLHAFLAVIIFIFFYSLT